MKRKKVRKVQKNMVDLRPCITAKNYFVDDGGNIYRKLNLGVGSAGYKRVMLTMNGVRKYVSLHRLVLEAFTGRSSKKLVTRHLNGNKLDNRIKNLKFGTMKENAKDTVMHGRSNYGERHPMRKLSTEDVSTVRRMIKSGHSKSYLARHFKVSHGCISDIEKGRTWVKP